VHFEYENSSSAFEKLSSPHAQYKACFVVVNLETVGLVQGCEVDTF
jgi:hypothetical protein